MAEVGVESLSSWRPLARSLFMSSLVVTVCRLSIVPLSSIMSGMMSGTILIYSSHSKDLRHLDLDAAR